MLAPAGATEWRAVARRERKVRFPAGFSRFALTSEWFPDTFMFWAHRGAVAQDPKGETQMDQDAASGMASVVALIAILAIFVLVIVAGWKIFTKAGRPGWASIVPIYNTWIMLEIAGKPGWWLILFFIPIVSIVIAFMMCIGLAERFGKGAGFGVGLALLPFIFMPILAFGDARYQDAGLASSMQTLDLS
jgi:uncharacterized membrane protein YphA (DoxX/SURF4 family)